MWWDRLDILEAVVRYGKMSRAAEELSVDKATVSRQLVRLAQDAPAPLFERGPSGIELTPYGTRALRAYQRHCQARRALEVELEVSEHDLRSTVRLTAPSFFGCHVLVPGMRAFARENPGISIELNSTTRLLDVLQYETDVAVRNVRPTATGLAFSKVGRLGLSLYASKEYLREHGGLRAPGDLHGHDFISYDGGPYTGNGFGWLREAIAQARVTFYANDAAALYTAASAGLGLAVLPHCLAEQAPELIRVTPGAYGITDIFVVTREEQRRVPRIRAVVSFVTEQVRARQAQLCSLGPGGSL